MSDAVASPRWDIPEDKLRTAVGGIVGALSAAPDGLDPLQWEMLESVVHDVLESDLDPRAVPVVRPAELGQAIPLPYPRLVIVHLMTTLAFVRHPEVPAVAAAIEEYASALGIDEPMVHAARLYADEQAALLYLDIERNCEFTEQTLDRIVHGHLWRVIRNKLAYTGIVADEAIAKRWQALDDCAPGTWGGELAAFYHDNQFHYPGERHGIGEVGARHDWVHVLAEYPPTPEGEIDVFAFIAASMPDPRGFTQFVMTLGLFQNGTIHHVAGKRIRTARVDTLSDQGAVHRWADALRRGASCNVDVMNLDHFAYKDLPLEEARERFGVVAKGDDARSPSGATPLPPTG
jgi:hypothetical protein